MCTSDIFALVARRAYWKEKKNTLEKSVRNKWTMYIIREKCFYVNWNTILEWKVPRESTRKHGFTKREKKKKKKKGKKEKKGKEKREERKKKKKG